MTDDDTSTRSQTLHRQALLAQRLVALADTLVEDFDIVELLDDLMNTSLELLEVDEAGLMLVDRTGRLQLLASSSESARMLELLQLQSQEGPCVDVLRTGRPVIVGNLRTERQGAAWPAFTRQAMVNEFRSVYAFPMRLRDEIIGGVNLFGRHSKTLDADAQAIAQSLADIATIGIVQQRAVERSSILAENLQRALNTRVVIEQAKGVLAERGQLSMDEAFELLRSYARTHHLKLGIAAHAVVHPPHVAERVLRSRPD